MSDAVIEDRGYSFAPENHYGTSPWAAPRSWDVMAMQVSQYRNSTEVQKIWANWALVGATDSAHLCPFFLFSY